MLTILPSPDMDDFYSKIEKNIGEMTMKNIFDLKIVELQSWMEYNGEKGLELNKFLIGFIKEL